MKNIFLLFISLVILYSCKHKTDVKPGSGDTLNITPPAALDTMKLQTRPADSLLKTKRY